LVAVHVAPFHTSAKPNPVVPFVSFMLRPTAEQCDGEEHDTSATVPKSRLTAPACCRVNALPFHDANSRLSASVFPVAGVVMPATTHEVSEKQCAAVSSPSDVPGSVTADLRAQLFPFQVQTTWSVSLELNTDPIATQLLTATQETADRTSRSERDGMG